MRTEGPCTNRIAGGAPHDSDVHPREQHLIAKVSPLPIGIKLPCQPHVTAAYRSIVATSPPLLARNLQILVAFETARSRDRRKYALWELTRSCCQKRLHHRSTETEMFELIAKASFVASPASRGQDTHRFWETIALGAIPIVQAGPLDFVYRRMPCVIVPHWANITEDKLRDWRRKIVDAFGEQPQKDPRVARLLSSHYLARRIASAQPLLHDGPADSGDEPRRGIVNHTCALHLGGVLSEARRAQLGC